MNNHIGMWRGALTASPTRPTPLYTLTEASVRMGVTLERLRRLLGPYKIEPVATLGKRKRYRLTDLQSAHKQYLATLA